MKHTIAIVLLLAAMFSATAAKLEVGNFVMGRGTIGFGVLAEYGEGGPREIVLTRITKPGANKLAPNYFQRWGMLCAFRIYDPAGNLVEYVELGEQSEAEKVYRIKIPAGPAGIWRFSQNGGLSGDRFIIEFPENGVWGVRGEKTLRVINGFPEKMFMFIPENSEKLVLIQSGGVKFSVDGKTSKCSVGDRIIADKPADKQILEVDFPARKPKAGFSLCFDGFPSLLCPSPEAALKLKGGLVKVEERYFEGPLQARAWQYIRNFKPEDFTLPEAALTMKRWPGPIADQVIDRDDINYGLHRKWTQRSTVNFLKYQHGYYLPGLYAMYAAIDEPANQDTYKQPGMINRTILAAFDMIANMDAAGIVRSGDVRDAGRLDVATQFEPFFAICRSYYYIKSLLPPEADQIFREGVSQITDKQIGCISYQSNQWMHIINGFSYTFQATGEPRFKRDFEIQMHTFLDNTIQGKHGQHPAGYYIEDGGPDGNYDNMSGYPIAEIYYTYGKRTDANPELVTKLRRAIEKNMVFKSLFMFGDRYALPYANNHRIWGTLIGDGYPSIFLTSKEFDYAYSLLNWKNDPPKLPKDRGGEAGMLWRPLEHTSKRVKLPSEYESGIWELDGHMAWKHASGLYGMVFWSVYDKYPDGIMGPLFIWQKDAGLAVASIKNKNKIYLTATKPEEVTWSSVTGTLGGKFFYSEIKCQKKLEWIEKDQVFRVTGTVLKDKTDVIGTISWEYDLRGKDGIEMTIKADVPGLENPTLSIPFYAHGGKNNGKIIENGVFHFTSPSGTMVMKYPASVQASLIEKMNADTFALRLPLDSKELKLSLSGN